VTGNGVRILAEAEFVYLLSSIPMGSGHTQSMVTGGSCDGGKAAGA
jgi:hypothetical protein